MTAYEKEILKKLQVILTIDTETQRVRYKYGRGKYSLKNGFLYKLTDSAGIEVYEMQFFYENQKAAMNAIQSISLIAVSIFLPVFSHFLSKNRYLG